MALRVINMWEPLIKDNLKLLASFQKQYGYLATNCRSQNIQPFIKVKEVVPVLFLN